VLVSCSTGAGASIGAFFVMSLTCSLVGDWLRDRVTRAVRVSFSTGARAAVDVFFGEMPFFLGDTDGLLSICTLEVAPVTAAGFFEGDPGPPADETSISPLFLEDTERLESRLSFKRPRVLFFKARRPLFLGDAPVGTGSLDDAAAFLRASILAMGVSSAARNKPAKLVMGLPVLSVSR
jgi:hypothetical protein